MLLRCFFFSRAFDLCSVIITGLASGMRLYLGCSCLSLEKTKKIHTRIKWRNILVYYYYSRLDAFQNHPRSMAFGTTHCRSPLSRRVMRARMKFWVRGVHPLYGTICLWGLLLSWTLGVSVCVCVIVEYNMRVYTPWCHTTRLPAVFVSRFGFCVLGGRG